MWEGTSKLLFLVVFEEVCFFKVGDSHTEKMVRAGQFGDTEKDRRHRGSKTEKKR